MHSTRAYFVCPAIWCIHFASGNHVYFFYHATTLSWISVLVLYCVSRLNLICDSNQLLLNFFESRSLLHIACKSSQAEVDDGTEQPSSTTVQAFEIPDPVNYAFCCHKLEGCPTMRIREIYQVWRWRRRRMFSFRNRDWRSDATILLCYPSLYSISFLLEFYNL